MDTITKLWKIQVWPLWGFWLGKN